MCIYIDIFKEIYKTLFTEQLLGPLCSYLK